MPKGFFAGPQVLSTDGRPLREGAPTYTQVPYNLPIMRKWRLSPQSTNQSLCGGHPHLARGGHPWCSSALILSCHVLAGYVFRAFCQSSSSLLHAQGFRRLPPLLGSCPLSLRWWLLLRRVLCSCASAQPPHSGGTSILMLSLRGQRNAAPPLGFYKVSAASLVLHRLYVRGPEDSSGFCSFALTRCLCWSSNALSTYAQFLILNWAFPKVLAAGWAFWGLGLSLL